MEIEVGEYTRSISGEIDKVDALYGMIENTIHLEKHKWQNIKNIKKHSKNLIDIVELGDYVNGEKITMYGTYMKHKTVENESCFFVNEDIESVVTKQQFSNIEYKVEE